VPKTVNQHLVSAGTAAAPVELRSFGYTKYATVAALPASGAAGEIVTVTATGDNYCWNASDGAWRRVVQSVNLYPYLKTAGGVINTAITADITAGRLAVGDAIQTGAYVQNGSVGGCTYRIVVAGTGTDDGGSYITAGSVQLAAQFNGRCNVHQFGAVNGSDATTKIQAFFDYIAATNVGTAVFDGTFNVSSGLVLGPAAGTIATLSMTGRASITATASIDLLFDVRNASKFFHNGELVLSGTGATTYASRTCRMGFRMTNVTDARFAAVQVAHFWQTGISVEDNCYMSEIDNIVASDCGSWGTGGNLTTTYSAWANVGAASSTAQVSRITVATLPPTMTPTTAPYFASIGGFPYYITAVNTGAGTIDVYPWLDSTTAATGSFGYIFGAAFQSTGALNSATGIGLIDAIRCGIGINQGSLYGPHCRRLVTQACGIATSFGLSPADAHRTYKIDYLYTETNTFDIVRVTRADTVGVEISGAAIDPTKCFAIGVPRAADNSFYVYADGGDFADMEVNFGHGRRQYEKMSLGRFFNPWGLDVTSGDANRRQTGQRSFTYKTNSMSISLLTPNPSVNRLFGSDNVTLEFIGTGNRGTPTGTFTFTPPAGWSINGGVVGTAITVSGFSGPARFNLMADLNASNFLIWQTNRGTPTSGTTAARPTLAAADLGYTYFDTTLNSPIWWSGSAWVDAIPGAGQYSGSITGTGAATTFTVTHGLGLASPFIPGAVTILHPNGSLVPAGAVTVNNLTANTFDLVFAAAPLGTETYQLRVSY
jgi:hypothetical protein